MTELRPALADMLFVVQQNGPVTVRDAARHAYCDPGVARSRLNSLENRGLVARQYTGLGGHAMGFTITDAGEDTLDALDGNDARPEGICDLCDRPFDNHSSMCMLHPDKIARRQAARIAKENR